MSKPRGRPRSFDSHTALQGAMTLFWQQGLSATSLDELATAMQMNRPSIYNAFGNKEQVYRQALAMFCGQLDQALHETLGAEPDLAKALNRFFAQALDVYCTGNESLGCLMMCTAPAEAATHPEVSADMAGLIKRVDRQLSTRLRAAIQQGALSPETEAQSLAKLLQAVLHSLALRARAGESRASLLKFARYSVRRLIH